MKNNITLLFALLLTTLGLAQSPEGFNYQAIIRDAANEIVANQNVGIQFRLLQDVPSGTAVYTEIHTATTDAYGLVALQIGTGTTSDTFADIDWANGPYFLEVAADITGGTAYSVLGTQQLMSVPYALYANSSGSSTPSNQITDADNDTKILVEETADEDVIRFDIAADERLRLQNNIHGFTQIETPNNGRNILIGEEAGKNVNQINGRNIFIGVEAGTNTETGQHNVSIGSFSGKNMVSGSTNVFVGGNAGAQSQGNGNVGLGYWTGPASGSNNVLLGREAGKYLNASDRLFIENTASSDPLIYGEFDNDLLRINGDFEVTGTLTGDGSGLTNLPSVIPTLISDADGDTQIQVEETADEDAIRLDLGGIEYFKMQNGRINVSNTGGSVFMGSDAGLNDDLSDNKNVFIGDEAGKMGVETRFNVAVGNRALTLNTSGHNNAVVGSLALKANTTGGKNAVLGSRALYTNTTGSSNIAIGYLAGYKNLEGSNNVFIGENSGFFNTGNRNVFIGHNSGYSEQESDKLYIENSNSNTPLIYGEFNNDLVRINGDLEVTGSYPDTDDQTLSLSGDNLSISEGNSVDLSGIDTDDQTLSLSGDNLSISEGNSVDLSGIDTDDQTVDELNLNGNTLEISLSDDGEATKTLDLSTFDEVPNTYTLPSTDGEKGQVLQTNGSGSVSWGVQIIKVTKNLNFGTVNSNDVKFVNIDVSGTNAQVWSTVYISPQQDYPGSVYIGNCRVSATNTVRVQLLNEGSNNQTIPAMNYYITIIK